MGLKEKLPRRHNDRGGEESACLFELKQQARKQKSGGTRDLLGCGPCGFVSKTYKLGLSRFTTIPCRPKKI